MTTNTKPPEGFYFTSMDPADFAKAGDIFFTVGDVPVVIEEIVTFPSGRGSAARVRYVGIAYRSGTVGVESLDDLTTETHFESETRWRADYDSVGTWPLPRNVADGYHVDAAIRAIPGASQERYAEFMQTMATSAKRGAL